MEGRGKMNYKNKKYVLSVILIIAILAIYFVISNRPGFSDFANMNTQNGTGQSADAGDNSPAGDHDTAGQSAGDAGSGIAGGQNSSDIGDTSGSNTAGEADNTSDPAGSQDTSDTDDADYVRYYFRNDKLLTQHYEKHGIEMGFDSKEAYEKAASDVVNNPAALHKTEKEDGDYVYYVEKTNEFVIVSTDGYLRTYFLPNAGISYYNRQ